MKNPVIAVLTIKDVSKLTTRGKKAVAAWLLEQANRFVKEAPTYSNGYRARYIGLSTQYESKNK